MTSLYLEDMNGMTESEIKNHVATYYQEYAYSGLNVPDKCLLDELKQYNILIAYEEEGGYDGESYFLLRKKSNGRYYEVHGSHCSYYGFEGQWGPELCSKKYLNSDKWNCGIQLNEHENLVRAYIKRYVTTSNKSLDKPE